MTTHGLMTASIVLTALLAPAAFASPMKLQPPATVELDVRREPNRFKSGGGEVVDAEWGTFLVPENRDIDASRTIRLSFVRFPSTTNRPGAPIVYLAGGPGGSGIGAARGSRFELFMALREVADVIAFDQRGTGDSEPDLSCEEPYSALMDRPAGKAEIGRIRAEAAAACHARLLTRGVDLAGYTTSENARDLDALSRALGAKRISLLGVSYGSHLALAAMRELGDRIDRVVLAGVEPLHHTYKLPSDQQTLLESIAIDVARDPAWGKRLPDMVGSIEGLLTRLRLEPVTALAADPTTGEPQTVVIGAFDLQSALTSRMAGPDEQATIAELVLALESGDYAELAQWTIRLRQGVVRPAMSTTMDCASGGGTGWLELIAAEAATTLLGDAINLPFPEICRGADVPDLGDRFRAPVVSERPVLLLSGTRDGRTPPRNATEVLPGLSRAHHILLEGAGHGSPLLIGSEEIIGTLVDFFGGGAPDTHLIEVAQPQLAAPREPLDLPESILRRYVGDFAIPEGGVRSVLLVGDSLYTKRDQGPVFLIRPMSETRFYYPGSDTEVEFVVEDGCTEAMVMRDGDSVADPAPRIETLD